jgi:uncharacterized membrane protein YfcA
MEISSFDATMAVIVAGSFLASVANAVFSAGGALIILAITSVVLPIQAIVPVHSTLLIGSTATRVLFFWEHIDWKIAGPFLVGSLFGALIGARVYIELPEAVVAAAISLLMLIALWLPKVTWRPRLRHPWAIVGFIHTLISTMFAYGALLHSVILHTDLKRQQIVGTMAGGLTGMGVFKITGYIVVGFDYSPYLVTIAAAVAVSFLGTAVGKHLGNRLSEDKFRFIYRVLITITALRLLYVGLAQGII